MRRRLRTREHRISSSTYERMLHDAAVFVLNQRALMLPKEAVPKNELEEVVVAIAGQVELISIGKSFIVR